jgi:hypothetical protein
MGAKSYSLRSVGKAGKVEDGRVRRIWEILRTTLNRDQQSKVENVLHNRAA